MIIEYVARPSTVSVPCEVTIIGAPALAAPMKSFSQIERSNAVAFVRGKVGITQVATDGSATALTAARSKTRLA